MILLLLIAFCILPPATPAGEKWSGVDESVIEKVAKEHGQEPRKPLINTDQGDLLLFVFLLAGVVGGFIGGYYWRVLTEKKVARSDVLKKDV
jgi:cobalt/nickel transport system permease protein